MTDTTPTPPKKKTLANLEINDVVDSWCGKCGEITPHKVNTLQPPKPPKSVCLTCKAIHQVRFQKPGSKTPAPSVISNIPPWSELIEGADPEKAKQYTITGNFEEGALIMHKIFGLGRVVTVSGLNRAQMSFESGVKLMIQNHGLWFECMELGSEQAVKSAGKMGLEGEEYVVQDGDIRHFLFNV